MKEEIKNSIKNAKRRELEEAYAYLDKLVKEGKINPITQDKKISELEERKQFKIEELKNCSENWQISKDQISLACLIGIISLGAMILGIGSIKELSQIASDSPSSFLSLTSISLTSVGTASEFLSIRELLIALSKKAKLERKIDILSHDIETLEGRKR